MPDNGEWQRTTESPEREARRMEALGLEKKSDIRKTVDSVIESVGEKIKGNDTLPGEYADTIKALAMLVEARASLY